MKNTPPKDNKVMFKYRNINGFYPVKHVLICEDNIIQQKKILEHLSNIFEAKHLIQFSCVPGGLAASALIHHLKIDLIILDQDMPEGNGTDLIKWMQKWDIKIPIITFSDIAADNMDLYMTSSGLCLKSYHKKEIIDGAADDLIKTTLEIK